MATKSEINAAAKRVEVLRAELADPYTVGLGAAAVRCVRESLDAAERRLAALKGGA